MFIWWKYWLMADYYTSLPDSVFSDITFLAELAMVGT